MTRSQFVSRWCDIMRIKCYEYQSLFDNDNENHARGDFCGHRERNVVKCDLLLSRLFINIF